MNEPIELLEARKLIDLIEKSQMEFRYNKTEFSESEVLYRLETVKGFLCIAHNEAREMLKSWTTVHGPLKEKEDE